MLAEQLENPDMMEFLLPSLIALVEHSSDEDFKSIIHPEFKKVFTMTRPVQVKFQVSTAFFVSVFLLN